MSLLSKKNFLYEVDPLFFCDSSKDGYGDFKGFKSKIEYFKHLNIDGLVFPDIFNQEKDIAKPIDVSVFDKYGTAKDLKDLLLELEKENISLYVTINLNNIRKSMLNIFDEWEYKKNEFKFSIKESMDNDEKKWLVEEEIKAIKNVINFWTKHGINNFIFSNFENISKQKTKIFFTNSLVEQLKEVYSLVKSINKKAFIGLRSNSVSTQNVNILFQKYIGQICDFFFDNSFAFLCTNKQRPFDLKVKFNPMKIYKKIKKIKIEKSLEHKYIVSFGSNQIGRVFSRWMNETILHYESAKSLLLLIHSMPYSSSNYYGDELGVLRIKVESYLNYFDFDFNEKKRRLELNKIKLNDFEESQKYLSKINSQSFFVWNKKGYKRPKNELVRNTILKQNITNVEHQYYDQNSILNFYKSIIDFTKNNFELFSSYEKFKIKKIKFKSLILFEYKTKDKKYKYLINLNERFYFVKINKNLKPFVSTYSLKEYDKKIRALNPYESIVAHN